MSASALQKLAKWRAVFAGWQIGTRHRDEPGVAAVRDFQERNIIMRAELNALLSLLMERGVFTIREWEVRVELAAEDLDQQYELLFPGYSTTSSGVTIDPKVARETNERMGFPP